MLPIVVILCTIKVSIGIRINTFKEIDTCPLACIGPTGRAGEVGQPGRPGPAGQKGEKGDIGQTGERGVAGPIGNRGPIGLPGANWAIPGDRGKVGPKGDQGIPGLQGRRGPRGRVDYKVDYKAARFLKKTLVFSRNYTDTIQTLVYLILDEFANNANARSELQSIMNATRVERVYSEQVNAQVADEMEASVGAAYNFACTYWYYIVAIGASVGLLLQCIRCRSRCRGAEQFAKEDNVPTENTHQSGDEHFYNRLTFISPLED